MSASHKRPGWVRPLMAWYARTARDLPWRRTRNPYAIWVAEIMLQQTQVETVKPYYTRFLERFGSVEVLARARLDSVLKLWEGLGYYARARHLHAAARYLCRHHAGRLPDTIEALRSLPGVGRYTAGAIASIAFGRDEPVLDGNVSRVLCRLYAIEQDPKSADCQERLWALAAAALPAGRAGTFNQAMMDLGARICLPRRPLCPDCPVRRHCRALAESRVEQLPVRRAARPLPRHIIAVGIVWKDGRVLIDRRRPEGMLGGLWEFPGGKKRPDETLQEAVAREVYEEVRIHVEVGRKRIMVDHAYSHFRIRLHAYDCRYVSGRLHPCGCTAARWVRPDRLGTYAFPGANQRIIESILAEPDPPDR